MGQVCGGEGKGFGEYNRDVADLSTLQQLLAKLCVKLQVLLMQFSFNINYYIVLISLLIFIL